MNIGLFRWLAFLDFIKACRVWQFPSVRLNVASSGFCQFGRSRPAWRLFSSGPGRAAWLPAIDVIEQKDSYLMYAELPGVDPPQIDITFEQNVLTVRGTKPSTVQASNDGELRVFAAERVTGSFERSIRLPEFVDGDHIAAEFNNGLLKIQVPKAQAAQPRRIEVKPSTQAVSNN